GAGADLWVRTATRTLRYQGGKLTDGAPPAPLSSGSPRVLCETRRGQVWVGADCGVFVARDGRFEEALTGTGLVHAILEDRRGDLWVGAGYGLYRSTDGGPFRRLDGLPQADVLALEEDRDGGLWAGTINGLYRIVDGRRDPANGPPRLAGKVVSAVLQDRDGVIWAGTSGA